MKEKQPGEDALVIICRKLPFGLTILSEMAGQCNLPDPDCEFARKTKNHNAHCNKKTFTRLQQPMAV